MDKNRKLKWDKAIKGREITTTYGENYTAGDDTKGLFQQSDDNSWTPVSVEQARDIYVPNVTDPVSNSYTQLGPMPTLTVTSPDWETTPYNVEDNRFGARTPITTINVRKNKNTGKILPEDYRQVLAIKDWYAKQHPKSDPSENFINDLVFTAATLGANKNAEAAGKLFSAVSSKIDPVVRNSVKNYIIKPLIAGSIYDNAQELAFDQSGSDYFTNYLTNKGWNPVAVSVVGASTNPAYLVNFGGGLASGKLPETAKILLGIESKNELGKHLWQKPPGLLQTKVAKIYNNGTLWDRYTTIGGRFGYYGNPLQRVVGTISRNLGVKSTPRHPEMLRKLEGLPKALEDGRVDFNSARTRLLGEGHSNWTLDRPVVSHGKGDWDRLNLFIVDPVEFQKSVPRQNVMSIEPSDTFVQGADAFIDPKRVTIVSGDPESLEQARRMGMSILSSPRLRKLYKSGKDNYLYTLEQQRLQQRRGAPTLQDFRLIENHYGLNSGVIPISDYFSNSLENAFNKMMEEQNIGSWIYPNGREIQLIPGGTYLSNAQQEIKLINKAPYRNVFYDPTSHIEANTIW